MRPLYIEGSRPHFVWVAKLYRYEKYLDAGAKAFAEVVLDATAPDADDQVTKTILMRHPKRAHCGFHDGRFASVSFDRPEVIDSNGENLQLVRRGRRIH